MELPQGIAGVSALRGFSSSPKRTRAADWGSIVFHSAALEGGN